MRPKALKSASCYVSTFFGFSCSDVSSPGVTNVFETESYFMVQIHAKGYQSDAHTSEIKICSICLQLCYQ